MKTILLITLLGSVIVSAGDFCGQVIKNVEGCTTCADYLLKTSKGKIELLPMNRDVLGKMQRFQETGDDICTDNTHTVETVGLRNPRQFLKVNTIERL